MKLPQNRWLGWAAVIALFLGIQFGAHRDLASGEPPALSGLTLDGEHFALAQLRGRPAVVYFWAEWCPICRAMQGPVQAVAQDYPLISLAMQSGNGAAVGEYMRRQKFQVPTLLDEDGAVAGRYGLRGVPAVFILSPDGQIRYATTGYTSEAGLRLRLWLAGR